ncbi:MAG: phage holin family protein [Pseudomonadota bacterium]
MIRTLGVAADLAGQVETGARARAEQQMKRMGLKIAAGIFAGGALVFLSVAFIAGLGPALGYGTAALIVGIAWLATAIGLMVAVMVAYREPRQPMVPPRAAEEMLGALAADFGRNSQVLTVAALVAGIIAARSR